MRWFERINAISLLLIVVVKENRKMCTKFKIFFLILLANLVVEISGEMNKNIVLVTSLINYFKLFLGHGMVMDPVNRASRWRKDGSQPQDYDDNQAWCGGFGAQWFQNGGKCGLCGDNYNDAKPRAHELGGKFGAGVIVKSYNQGATIPVTVKLTVTHKGYFYFKICNLDKERESDACFEQNKIPTTVGATWPLKSDESKDYLVYLQLPSGLFCNRCVLQWTYVTGNNWGKCPDGTEKIGCGPQEHFRTCSDIRINRA
jgi:Lytic polysaccharide mono-oxygenase, cellulose-degrading